VKYQTNTKSSQPMSKPLRLFHNLLQWTCFSLPAGQMNCFLKCFIMGPYWWTSTVFYSVCPQAVLLWPVSTQTQCKTDCYKQFNWNTKSSSIYQQSN